MIAVNQPGIIQILVALQIKPVCLEVAVLKKLHSSVINNIAVNLALHVVLLVVVILEMYVWGPISAAHKVLPYFADNIAVQQEQTAVEMDVVHKEQVAVGQVVVLLALSVVELINVAEAFQEKLLKFFQ